jgi:copper transport protein
MTVAPSRRGFALGLAVVALLSLATPAALSAHALLKSSTPASGAVLGDAPQNVTLTFTETPDLRLTQVKVLDSAGADHVSGPVVAVDAPPFSLSAPLGKLGDGAYTVSWRAVSAVDGHVSAGSFAFGVGVAPPTAAPDSGGAGVSESGSPPAVLARWLLYLGFVALIGAAFVAVVVARRPAPDLLAMAAIGWVLVALGTLAVIAVQWAETGAPLETLVSTSVGVAALGRVASLGLAGLALAILGVSKGAMTARAWLGVLAAGILLVFVDVATGHAAAGPGGPTQIGVQWIHGLSAAAWVGGLAALLVVLRSTPREARLALARRFSTWAGIALAGVAMTGLFRAIDEIGSFGGFLTTDFGRIVLLKTGFLIVVAGLGALNR